MSGPTRTLGFLQQLELTLGRSPANATRMENTGSAFDVSSCSPCQTSHEELGNAG